MVQGRAVELLDHRAAAASVRQTVT